MNRMPCLILCLSLLGLLALLPALRADIPPPQPMPPKMDAALRATRPGGVALAVNAAQVSLSPAAVVPSTPLTAQEVGALYGRTTQTFGSVLAIAPPTVTVVHTPPDTPNAYDGMAPGQVMKLLAKTFTPAQWKAFLSPSGVACTDMTGDTQPALFQAMFPGGHLSLIDTRTDNMDNPKFKREFPGTALAAARLRLTCFTSLALQMTDNPNSHMFAADTRPDGSPPLYVVTNAPARNVDHEYGATVREEVANTPKPSQMAFDDPALRAAVPLTNIKTVDDLIIHIGVGVHREIYADPRFGARLVTFAPSNAASPSAPAADLLQAVALCVGGTYRRVGTAYVLTDDTVGLGTKHVLWKAFEDKAAAMLPGSNEFMPAPSSIPDVPYTVKDIPDNGDPLAMTPRQKEGYWKKWALEAGQSSRFSMDVTVPFAQLSPAQQEAAQMDQEANEKGHERTTLDGTVMVQSEAEVEVLLPGLTGQAIITESYDGLLPYPALTPAEQQAQRKHMEAEYPGTAGSDVPAPDFTQTLRGFARRAARLALPKTVKEVSRTFAALRALGFTEAWLSVTPGPPAADADTAARLTLAVAEGKKRGIAVFPAINLLHWSDSTDLGLLDCDIQGRTVFPRYNTQSPPTVSPFVPAAARRLSALVRALGSVPGLGGMVWDDTLTSGYERAVPGENIGSDDSTPLGYTESGRLAFLRSAHADPVDVCDNSYSDERAQVHVPGFDSDSGQEAHLFSGWRKMRADISQNFLRFLASALPASFTEAKPRLPLLLPPSNATFASSCGSWDDFSQLPPFVRFIAQTGPDGQPIMGTPSTEKMSSLLAYTKMQNYLLPHASAKAWQDSAARSLVQAAKRGDKNVVLDLTGQAALLEEAAPPKPVTAPTRG